MKLLNMPTNKDTFTDAVYIMSEGNPGAVVTIMESFKHLGMQECIRFMLTLDSKGIYGSRIWFGYKYCFCFNIKDYVEWVYR